MTPESILARWYAGWKLTTLERVQLHCSGIIAEDRIKIESLKKLHCPLAARDSRVMEEEVAVLKRVMALIDNPE